MNDQEQAQLDALQEQVADLVATVEAVARDAQQRAKPKAATGGEQPRAWVDHASVDDWVELADWVDWLIATYDLSSNYRINPCWPAHTGVAEELAALWSAWKVAAVAARTEGGDALAFWHDRYLATLLARLNTTYGILACGDRRHDGPFRGQATNRTLIDGCSAAVAAEQPSLPAESTAKDHQAGPSCP